MAAYKSYPISSNGTFSPLAAGAVLHSVAVCGITAAWSVQLFDGPSTGNPFATITNPGGLGTLIFDVTLVNGLTVVASGATPGYICIVGG